MNLLKNACKPIAPEPLLLSSELQNHAREPIKKGGGPFLPRSPSSLWICARPHFARCGVF